MADVAYIEKSSWYKSVADAIRNKKGTTAPILRDDFASEISSITGGSTLPEYDGTVVIEKAGTLVFSDAIIYMEGEATSFKETSSITLEGCFEVDTKPTENIQTSDFTTSTFNLYYVKDENDIFAYFESDGWVSVSMTTNGLSFKGEITDISQASEDGYYALMTEGVSV